MKKFSLLLVISLALASCYKTNIRLSSSAPAATSPAVADSMHFSLLGIIELSSPINLDAACGSESVVIEERLSFLGGIVNAVLGSVVPLLQVMNSTIHCK